jgi:cyanophycinase
VSAALAVLALLSPLYPASAGESPLPFAVEPAATVRGTLFICGGGRLPPEAMERFVEFAGGQQAHIVIVTTASETADSNEVDSRIDFFRKARLAELTVLHTRSRETADDANFRKPLTNATGVWFIGGIQERLTEVYRGTKAEAAIRDVLERGGVVGGTSAGAAVMSPVMIRGGIEQAEIGEGFGFLPGTVIDQHFIKRRREVRRVNAVSAHPRLVGLGIDEGTILVVQGRRLSVLRESVSKVITCLAPIDGRPAQISILEPGSEIDLVALRRAALARVQPRFRFDDDLPAPAVPEGTLVLTGGGETPADAARRFVEAAGGAESLLVVVTTALGEQPPTEAEAVGWLTAAGARQVRRVHPRNPKEAEDPFVLEALRQAGGVWFLGGRQWRLVDAFADTAAERLLHEVLSRGGAIGGSAAGASMSAGYLVRGNPLGNAPIIAEGYEEGFGFLPGAAVDPYFTQRNRFADMAELKQKYPQLLGLGLDEGSAIVVKGHEFDVLGRNHVNVFARREPAAEGARDFIVLKAGDRYDLRDHKRMGPERSEADETAADSGDPQPQPALVCE